MVDLSPVSQQIWDMKYRLKEAGGQPVDKTVQDTWRRVARAMSQNEADPSLWEQRFFDAMDGFKFFWISDSCPSSVKAVTDMAPFEVLSLAEPIAAALQV